MDTAPAPDAEEPANLRFLRRLVTVLTATMIGGVLVIIALIVIRFYGPGAEPALPASITLPAGAEVSAFTQGSGWYAVVTGDGRILIYDGADGALMQEVAVDWAED